MITQIYDYLQSQRDDMLATLRTLVEHETPTDNKAAIDRAQEFLRAQFEMLGGEVETLPRREAGNHLRTEFTPTLTLSPGVSPLYGDTSRPCVSPPCGDTSRRAGRASRSQPPPRPSPVGDSSDGGPSEEGRWAGGGGDQLTILTHVDTVYPMGTLASMPFQHDGAIARGPGIFDMKGGIIIGLYALKALRTLNFVPPRKLVFLVTSDEETGSHSSRELIESEARQSDTVLVLEPGVGPQGAIKTWRKGIGGFWLTVKGRASHAGADPERGRSAIVELAHQILKIHALNDFEQGTTLNVGVVHGGTRMNVTAAEARAEIDVRVMTRDEWTRIERAVQSLQPVTPDTSLHIMGSLNRPPMERTAPIVARYEHAKKIAAQIGYQLDETGTGGGSDGNFTAALGIPTLDGLGAVGNGAHSPSEHIILDMLPKRAALVAGLLMDL